MKSFSQYVRNKFYEMDGSGTSMAVDRPDSRLWVRIRETLQT